MLIPRRTRRTPGQHGKPRRHKRGGFSLRWIPIILFGLYFGYYYFSHQERVPLTDRKQLVDLSREQEMALGLQSYQQILKDSKVVRSGRNAEIVKEIGQKIARAASNEDPGFEWEYTLIDSNQANAFCLPGGKVAVYTGIIPIAENVDGLAIVMGHEIAHAIARHGAERMAYQKLMQFGTMAAGAAIGGGMDINTQRAIMGAMGAGGQYGILLPFSRKHESEADYIGLLYAARSCYDPREAPKLWERMGKASGGAPAEFASTHPSPKTRIQQFEQWMPEALEIYKQNCGGYPPG
ncbi:MAG TPA: M48 family peptidase [Chromatiales bacterium]|nr:M48 family peptidase [Chromatiales bacterium]